MCSWPWPPRRADWFAEADSAVGENVRRYYVEAREQDLLLSHTLITPQVNRALPGPRQAGGNVAARIVRGAPHACLHR
ncbi:hypothetical protein HUT08_33345 [Streptomyces buecherae]|uniref:HpaB/PvcC/4-BUDH N-terminal domain-containing protein n=1 Tax=Streptomyces buecherae TaxID=2763006 RepID=A0A7H8NGJ7_9ACTN|nr:hypothetical protein HUT08_33345 [Streptomyces buecherae]